MTILDIPQHEQHTDASAWTPVCRLVDLAPERGAAALVDGEQVALFRLVDDTVRAVQQQDPFCGAFVLSRGIVGTRHVGDEVVATVASPMHKQVFDLRTGVCLDPVGKSPVAGLPADLRTWRVRVVDGVVEVAAHATPAVVDDEGSAG
ncbi:nitrite reductase small subunit NirD [Cellulomonas palmilytica]|uniref:nitrite reductase small subunit NirD n=1 Tax=Cellulomonas palmilytica TaxID=2608402 RepID=UPI001F1C74BA|nr:nitrite reductase small subunit NirD [Cellulomonas palmilytica]UJP39589.1 nitrite reductase small subunit NirD [Cellulomonas palmilytica]